MRTRALLVCVPISLLITAPAAAAEHPPRPFVASHGVKVKAAYIGQCPRRDRDCAIPGFFATTKPVPVEVGGVLHVNTRRRVRRLRMGLDCAHRKLTSSGNRRWTFEILGNGCTSGELDITYRRVSVTYTFSLRRYEPCRPEESETVTENAYARVYTVEVVYEADGERDVENHFFTCRFDSGVARYIGEYAEPYSGYFYVENVVLAEEKAAYVRGFADNRYENENRFTLYVLDTATMSVDRQLYFEVPSASNRDLRMTSVVLKPNGSVAWILYRQDWNYTQTYGVWKSDASGDPVQLDAGPDIDPDSLSLDGSTLTWTRAGAPRSATLD